MPSMSVLRQRSRIVSGRPSLAAACVAIALAGSDAALADDIYRWTDADGRVHFSDSKPVDDTPFETVELDIPPAPDYDPTEDPYSIMNQAASIHETWLELEAVRQADREARAANAPAPVPVRPLDDRYYASDYALAWPVDAPGRPNRGAGLQQIHALDELDLLGPRPASINSEAHRQRVERSQLLPFVPPPAPPPRPTPR